MEKPAVIVYENIENKDILNEILYGIEEEGIPYLVKRVTIENVISASYQAAVSSPLLVGAGINDNNVSIHHAQLDKNKPLFHIDLSNVTKKDIRKCGVNTARMVKGIAFIL